MRRNPLLAALAVLLVSPCAARGATVAVTGVGKPGEVPSVAYAAAPGERNRVTLSPGFSGSLLVHDAGAPLSLGSSFTYSCSSVDAHTVRCPAIAAHDVELGLGDGADTFSTTAPARVEVEGGPGNDVIVGGPRGDFLQGGAGDDFVRGGRGDDALGGGLGLDRLDGGAGLDFADYYDTRPGLSVDLRRARVVRGDGLDRLTAIEGVRGGLGADWLLGSDGPDRLEAGGYGSLFGRGHDLLVGRGGADRLTGSYDGPVTLEGGPGNDLLRSLNRFDRLSCGPGLDVVQPDADVLVPADCERIAALGLLFTYGRVVGSRLRIGVRNPRSQRGFVLRVGDREVKIGTSGTLSIPLRRHGVVTLTLLGDLADAAWRVRL